MRAPALHRHRFLFDCYSFEAVVGVGLEASASQNRIERVLARRGRPRKIELFGFRSKRVIRLGLSDDSHRQSLTWEEHRGLRFRPRRLFSWIHGCVARVFQNLADAGPPRLNLL